MALLRSGKNIGSGLRVIKNKGREREKSFLWRRRYDMAKFVSFLLSWVIPFGTIATCVGVVAVSSCSQSAQINSISNQEQNRYRQLATASHGPLVLAPPARPLQDPRDLLREVRVYKDLIPRGQHARKYRRAMDPRYITIHSTQNFSKGADAWRHSLALKNGKLKAHKSRYGNRIGYLVWHYSTDENVAVQHLPTNEQGEHADFNGPGNNYSIGIEMCEHRGNSRSETIERTAKLAAYLMHEHDIPLRNIVPHYHWARKGLSTPHKNCPHYLMDDGKPGKKWQWFLSRVKAYHDRITVPVPMNH